MNPQQLREVTARAEISKTPLGLMSGPAWRVGPSCVVSKALKKRTEVPSWSDIAGIPEAPQVWQLGQCRLCICRYVRRMGICSPGSARILHLWVTESNPGPIARTTTGTDHVCGLGVLRGQNRAQCSAGHG